ncbi:MAG: thrombospondin type 3 repeat-containing protein, partial [Thermoplasmatota archaeon]
DGICDAADNCPGLPNHDQRDTLGNGIGDACRAATHRTPPRPPRREQPLASDLDGDGIPDPADNCPVTPNRDQADLDGDGIGDVCDNDMDGDGIPNWAPGPTAILDNCPRVPNPDQRDSVGDGVGDACRGVTGFAAASVAKSGVTAIFPPGASLPHPLLWAVAFILVVGALGWAVLRRAGMIVLFSRLSGIHVLRHSVRARIMAKVEAEPGIHYRGIVRALALKTGVVQHHLGVLIAAGLVTRNESRQNVRFFAAGTSKGQQPISPLLSSRGQMILDFVDTHPGASLADVARAVGAPRSMASYHARRLAAAGLVRLERSGPRGRRLFPV